MPREWVSTLREVSMKKAILVVSITALALLAQAGYAAEGGGRPLATTLSGAAEVPGPGDSDGTGQFKATLNPGKLEICYELTVTGIATATAAHVHEGAVGAAGDPVVSLEAPADGSSSACVSVEREILLAIIKNPAGYYVNVHNAEFPDGAIRGQLSR
jgi:hypothetical protein